MLRPRKNKTLIIDTADAKSKTFIAAVPGSCRVIKTQISDPCTRRSYLCAGPIIIIVKD